MITGEFEGYSIVRNTFKGGMTDVYVARNSSGQRVILRILKDEYVRNRKIRKSFTESARILASMDHPMVVKVLAHGRHESTPYMALEYHESRTLRELIAKRDDLLPTHGLEVARQLAEAVAYVHRSGYLHLDIKPENILVKKDVSLVLIDFDLAVKRKVKPFKVKRLSGTPAYICPETLSLHIVDDRTDIFSYGVTCYETVTHQKPYPIKGEAVDYSGTPPPPNELASSCPPALSSVILKCLAKKPEYRYPSMSLVLKDLVALS